MNTRNSLRISQKTKEEKTIFDEKKRNKTVQEEC